MVASRWYAKFFEVASGLVHGEIPMVGLPTWDQQINTQSTWSITTLIGGAGNLSRETLRTLVKPGRFGVACCYGPGTATDYIAQAGPIWSHRLVSERPASLQISGSGMWGMLNARVQIPSTWTPGLGLADGDSVSIYAGSKQSIATQIIQNAVDRGSLPIDLAPAIAGTETMTYYGYDLASAGQRLQELSQGDGGPDVFFQPYFATASMIRWLALIGTPTIGNVGLPLLFDHGSNLMSALSTSDGSAMATDSYVKGNGTSTTIRWAYANDVSLITQGWPLLDKVDNNHSDEASQTVLDGYAMADQLLNGRTVETWDVTVRADGRHPLGSYGPGVTVGYNFTTHPWILPGRYDQRLLGLSSGSNAGEVKHLVQAIEGAV